MLIKILGVIDFLAGLLLIFGMGFKFPTILLNFIGGILILKSLIGFLSSFASWIDFLCGIVICTASLFLLPVWIYFPLGILLLQKGFFSFLAN